MSAPPSAVDDPLPEVEAPAAAPPARVPRRVPMSLLVGGGIVGLFVLLALVGPYVTPYPFDEFHFQSKLAGPSGEFWFGTDR